MIYLNQAGTSWPKPPAVVDAVADALAAPPECWPERLEAHHREVALAFGIRDPDDLLLTPGATSALAAAWASIALGPGDRVIVSAQVHQALLGPAQRLAALGVELVIAPRSDDEPVVLEAVEAELRSGGVRALAVSAACNVTGELLPVDALVALARRYGALSIIDAAQTAGWMTLDLPNLGADFVAFAGHKGPQAPWGIGGLYLSPALAWSDRTPRPGYCDVGSVDQAALAGLAAGLRWLAEPERERHLQHARRRAAVLAGALAGNRDITLHGLGPPETRMPTVALTARHRAPAELAAALAARGVIASSGKQCAPLTHETLGTGREGVLRLSVGPATEDADVETAAAALEEILASPAS